MRSRYFYSLIGLKLALLTAILVFAQPAEAKKDTKNLFIYMPLAYCDQADEVGRAVLSVLSPEGSDEDVWTGRGAVCTVRLTLPSR